MTASRINEIIERDYNSIYVDATNFINKSKHLDFDVIGYAYEQILKQKDRIKCDEDVKRFFLKNIAFASKLPKDKYRTLTKINPYEIKIVTTEQKFNPKDTIIDDYLSQCSTEDKIIIGLIESGHNTYSKLSDVTLMPISTLHLKVKEIKKRVENFKSKTNRDE